MLFAHRLELLPRLRGNNVIMSVKIENPLSPSIISNQADGAVAGSFFRIASLQALAFESALTQSVFENIGTGAIIVSRRVLRGYGHERRHQRRPFVLSEPEPTQERT